MTCDHPDPTPATTAGGQSPCFTALLGELEHAGYYPQVVVSVLETALAGQEVISYLVQPETTFADAVHRHLTVLALTPTRLVIVHVDDVPGADDAPVAMATSEAVPLRRIRAVGLTHAVRRPASGGELTELTVSIAWGAVRRLELEPVECPDPTCEADHGLSGFVAADDVTVRVSAAVEGREALEQARRFAQALSAATSGE